MYFGIICALTVSTPSLPYFRPYFEFMEIPQEILNSAKRLTDALSEIIDFLKRNPPPESLSHLKELENWDLENKSQQETMKDLTDLNKFEPRNAFESDILAYRQQIQPLFQEAMDAMKELGEHLDKFYGRKSTED